VFGKPVIISELKHKGLDLYIDGTFRIVLRPFYQMLMVMCYVLSMSKEYNAYLKIFPNLVDILGCKINSSTVCCDYEIALIKASKGRHIIIFFYHY
jgi:hypothetical protein